MFRVLASCVPFMCACVTSGCDPSETSLPFAPASSYAAPDPSIAGPYPVGVRTMVIEDPLRIDEDTDEPRSLVTEVWYPAVEEARDGPFVTYVLYDEVPPDLQEGLTPDDLGRLPTRAVRDAAPRADGDRFPVVIFSHGKGGIRQQSTFFTVFLASHGYVVASPEHAGDTTVDLLRDLKTGESTGTTVLEAMVDRPYDIAALLDALEALPADDPLTGVLDLDRVGMSGHSFGALTSFIAASRDSRIDVVVGQAPTSHEVIQLQSRGLMSELEKHSLIQSAALDRTLEEDTNARPLYESLGGPKAWVSLSAAGHFTYSDLCVIDLAALDAALDIDTTRVLSDGCGAENVATEIAFPAIRSSAIGWFNRWLRDSVGSERFVAQEALDALGVAGVVKREP